MKKQMSAQNLSNRHQTRKRTPTRFFEGVTRLPSSQPHQGNQQTTPKQSPQQSSESDLEMDEANNHPEESNEFIDESTLLKLRDTFECGICLGIIKKTRTIMDCLHRFCKECIDKSIRLGKKQCPTCGKQCASRRSLRDDVAFDTLINILFPNDVILDKEENAVNEKELVMHKEEYAVNEKVSKSVVKTRPRQSKAVDGKSLRMSAPSTSRTTSDSRRMSNPKGGRGASDCAFPIQVPFADEYAEDARNSTEQMVEKTGHSPASSNFIIDLNN